MISSYSCGSTSCSSPGLAVSRCRAANLYLLQREMPYEVSPFFRIHGGPNQEQIVYCCRDWQMLRNQEQPGTLTGRDKHCEVSWHRLEIVCDENPTVLRRVG